MSNKPIWSGLFSYSLTERRGLFLLFLLLFTLKLLPILHKWQEVEKTIPPEIITAFQSQIDSLHVEPSELPTPTRVSTHTEKKQLNLYPFNPNTISEKALIGFGLPIKLVTNWVNYTNAGGRFFSPEDLLRLYSMNPGVFEQLQPYIQIPKEEPSPQYREQVFLPDSSHHKTVQPKIAETSNESIIIDINQSTNEDWESIPGIGPVYAGKILRFRESLGGFSSVDQIGDTWHLPDSVFQSIRAHLISSPIYRSIEINTVNAEQLSKHPYLNSKQGKIICRYRENYGPFENLEDLKKTRILSDKDINNLKPYILF